MVLAWCDVIHLQSPMPFHFLLFLTQFNLILVFWEGKLLFVWSLLLFCCFFSLVSVNMVSLFCFCFCCVLSVGGGAPREHRGADAALGMPAGGEEPGAVEGESELECGGVDPGSCWDMSLMAPGLCPWGAALLNSYIYLDKNTGKKKKEESSSSRPWTVHLSGICLSW